MKFALSSPQGRPLVRAMTLAGPAYLWLLLAVFLPLSVMLFYSFMSALCRFEWNLTAAAIASNTLITRSGRT